MKRRSPKELEPDTDHAQVLWIMMSGNVKRVYDFRIDTADVTMLRLSAELTQKLGLEGPKLIAARTTGCLEHGMMLLYSENDTYNIGRVIYDRFTDLFAIVKDDYDFVFPSDVQAIGEPVGYCNDEEKRRNVEVSKNRLRY